MRLMRLLGRCTVTAVKLPFALAWDAVRMPVIASDGEQASSVAKTIKDHREMKAQDDYRDRMDK